MKDYSSLQEKLVELYGKCAVDLPSDVEEALYNARESEVDEKAAGIIAAILENVKTARETSRPMCQDTGTPIFYVKRPRGVEEGLLREAILDATRTATEVVPLRPNAVDPLTGVNSGDNTGTGFPVVHFEEWDKDEVRFDLMLKGGGSENATLLYKLPDVKLGAGRDVEGVMKCVLDAVVKVQGKACSPNIIGVGVGGLADTSISLSKKQFLRKLDDVNQDKQLAEMESKLLGKINSLGVGPMGLGGSTTALAVKVGRQHTNPPSFFVAVSFMCWACRRWDIGV
jgi:fumarate hydratase class I